MGVVRCPMGHYYDDQKFASCPHCGVSVNIQASKPADADKGEKKHGLFGWLDSHKTVAMNVHTGNEVRGNAERAEDEESAGQDSRESATIAMEASVPVFKEQDDQKTIGLYSGAKGNDYVVGWLVCTDGPEKGRDYRLHHGFNRIGRDYGMDVQVMDDPAITRENHCSVVYDDRSTGFTAVPGQGTLSYVNDDLLARAQTLQDGDELKIGNSTFVFIPFCRKGRVWERKENG